MKVEEIYFLKKIGFSIKDEEEIVTTDSVDKFPTISILIDELQKITDNKLSNYKDILKHTIYTSCMMHYTVDAFNRKLINQEIFDKVMNKSANIFRKAPKEAITLTLMYEGPHYLHPLILETYKKAGHSKIVKEFNDIFKKDIEKEAKARICKPLFEKEKEAYDDLYKNFIKKEIKF